MRLVFASCFTLLLGLILTLAARAASHRVGLVAAPRNDRWHQKPTPMLGGVAIYLSFT
jgi:UDP-GlcNAc:undecaprenyl-phosphate GlcNAc-1-phosphate transferase